MGTSYEIEGDYRNYLLEGLSNNEKFRINEEIKKSWGGACFGMSSVLALAHSGNLSPGFFNRTWNNLYDLSYPKNDKTALYLLHYYHLMQNTDITQKARFSYTANEADNNRAIVSAMQNSRYPVVIGFNILKSNGEVSGGHAVVGYDMETTSDSYRISIWDPNDKDSSLILAISKDYSSKSFNRNYPNTFMKYGLTVGSNTYDYKNIQQKMSSSQGLMFQSSAFLATAQAFSNSSNTYLITNYSNFYIESSDGYSATVSGGKKVSGDLDISLPDANNDIGEELELHFLLPTLMKESTYTVIPANEQISNITNEPLTIYRTALCNDDKQDGFYGKTKTDKIGSYVFCFDGSVSTNFESPTEITVSTAINNTSCSLYIAA